MGFPTFTLITCILVFILIITSALAIIFLIQRGQAFGHPSPLCFSTWKCNGGFDPVAAYVAVINACKVDPATGKVDTAKCNCSVNNWLSFYQPTSANSYTGQPPANPPANNCLSL